MLGTTAAGLTLAAPQTTSLADPPRAERAETEPSSPEAGAANAETPPSHFDRPLSVAGVEVRIDPATGRLRTPTDEEARALRRALRHLLDDPPLPGSPHRSLGAASQSPEPTVHPDGSMTAPVPTYLHEVSVVRLAADGELRHGCAQGLGDATELMALPWTPETAPAPEEE